MMPSGSDAVALLTADDKRRLVENSITLPPLGVGR